MDLIILLTVLLASSATGAVVVQRQTPTLPAGQDLQNLIGNIAKPVKIEDVKPRIRPDAKRQFIRYGPLLLPASKDGGASADGHSHGGMQGGIAPGSASGIPGLPGANGAPMAMDPDGFTFSRTMPAEGGGFCNDCSVLAAQADVVFENGTRGDIASGIYLHHVVTYIAGKKARNWVPTCPGDQKQIALPELLAGVNLTSLGGGAGFVGGAVDEFVDYFTSPDGSFESGFYIPPNSQASMSGEIINYRKEPQTAYIRIDLEWMPGKFGGDAIKTPLSVDGCNMGNKQWYEDRGTIKSEEWTITQNGTIVCQRGHMHDGGTDVTSFLNGKQICKSEATYGLPGGVLKVDGKDWKTISKMSECTTPVSVKQGDKLTHHASFDNIAHPLRTSHGEAQEDMGFMTFTFVPE